MTQQNSSGDTSAGDPSEDDTLAGGAPAVSSADPDTALALRCAEAMYAADEASRLLGIRIVEVTPGRAVARMDVDERMVNGHGIAHGGYLFLLADSAFAFACNTYNQATVAARADVTFVAPVRLGDELEALAEERVRYGRNGVYDVTVRRVSDGQVVAEFRGQSRALNQPLLPEDDIPTPTPPPSPPQPLPPT